MRDVSVDGGMIRIKLGSVVPACALASLLAACGTPARKDAATNAGDATAAHNMVAPGPGAPPAPATPAPAPAASAPLSSTPASGTSSSSTASAPTQAKYLGRWKGVEGMYLNVTAKPAGGVTLAMQYDLDHKGTYDGSVTAEGLRFIRDGEPLTAVPTDGDATGLKWLAGKKDCLTVKSGEGYCRD